MRTYKGRQIGGTILTRVGDLTKVCQADSLIEIADELLVQMVVTDGIVTFGDINPVTYRILEHWLISNTHIAERVEPDE